MNDLISRQDTIDAIIKKLGIRIDGHDYLLESEKAIVNVIKEMPSAESTGAMDEAIQHYIEEGYMMPIRPKGKWIDGKCDQCGEHAPYWSMATTYYCSNFCPNCGANMREEEK